MRLSQHFLILATICFLFAAPALADKPNILFIYLDDFGWKDTGYMGSDFYETPNIDALANGGMVFTDAYSCAANCAPARACLMSGQYTPRHKIFNVGTKPRGKAKCRRLKHVPGVDTLDPNLRTWAHQLQKAGYKTATMGKWHLSDDPMPYGFDLNIGGSHKGGPTAGYYGPHGKLPGLKNASKDEYVTDRLSDEAIKFIRKHKQEPWCVYLTHFAVHTPLNPKKELVEKYENKQKGKLHDHVKMATMIEAVDQGVGRIMETLAELKLRDNTVVIFYSDNGGYGPATDMHPLKGYKGTYYEGGIRVPFLVNWQGKVKAGQKCNEPISGVDLFPTLCELTNAKRPENQELDGVSLVDLFLGQKFKAKERALFWHFPAYLQSYAGVFDEQQDPLFRSRPCSVIRRGRWKLHQYFETGQIELYDLAADIGETKNLAKSKPETAKQLLEELSAWQKQINAPVPTEKNPAFDPAFEAKEIGKRRSATKSKK